MDILTSTTRGVFILMPNGAFDSNTAPEAEYLIKAAVDNGETRIVIDLGKIKYISSAGLRIILKAAKLLKPVSGKVAIANANEQAKEVLEVSGFMNLFGYFDTLEEALSVLAVPNQ